MSGANKRVTAKPGIVYSAQSCIAVREVLSLVGDKWSILLVVILESGTKRFSELRNSIEGISQRMLTLTLRELERDGLVNRLVEPTVPPSVYYSLTPLGKQLLEPVKGLAKWAQAHYPQIHAAQERFDKKKSA